QPVYALFLGSKITEKSRELLHYGVDKVFVYDAEALARFRIEPYCAAFEDFALNVKPAAILVGATTVGRQLAPRAAARLRTGLTADCTKLEMNENTDLVQIRPAFGGNIMAQILTPNTRPQMATVRYKVMSAPVRSPAPSGEIIPCALSPETLACKVEVLAVTPKPPERSIEAAEVLVVAGRGVKNQADLAMVEELAALLGGQLACTRPMAEAGWVDARRQVGLSGRTVRPKLILTCGVSGAIQFVAGMDHAEMIVAINRDEKASIFKVAHYGLVGDLYEILPPLIARIKAAKDGAKA
ncbi:MAG: electron transfer flavoprotein subunit alpha/FixB family protein, partial [Pseudoflavonifractor sp.]